MSTPVAAAPTSRAMVWSGRIVSVLPSLMLLFSAGMKLARPPVVVKGFNELGWPDSLVVGIGVVELICTVLYLVPQTAVLGAILLTGYLGGATATHLRIGQPYLGPVVFGMLLWLGLYLRDARLRALLPLRRLR